MLLGPPGISGGARVKATGGDRGVMEVGNMESRQMGPIHHQWVSALTVGRLKEERGGGGGGGWCHRVTLGHVSFNVSHVIDDVSLILWKNTIDRLICDFYRQGAKLNTHLNSYWEVTLSSVHYCCMYFCIWRWSSQTQKTRGSIILQRRANTALMQFSSGVSLFLRLHLFGTKGRRLCLGGRTGIFYWFILKCARNPTEYCNCCTTISLRMS